MQERNRNEKPDFLSWSFWQSLAPKIAQGTITGTFGRWITWPLEGATFLRADPTCKQNLWQIYRYTFKPQSLRELNKIFFKTGLGQTVGKSVFSVASTHVVDTDPRFFLQIRLRE